MARVVGRSQTLGREGGKANLVQPLEVLAAHALEAASRLNVARCMRAHRRHRLRHRGNWKEGERAREGKAWKDRAQKGRQKGTRAPVPKRAISVAEGTERRLRSEPQLCRHMRCIRAESGKLDLLRVGRIHGSTDDKLLVDAPSERAQRGLEKVLQALDICVCERLRPRPRAPQLNDRRVRHSHPQEPETAHSPALRSHPVPPSKPKLRPAKDRRASPLSIEVGRLRAFVPSTSLPEPPPDPVRTSRTKKHGKGRHIFKYEKCSTRSHRLDKEDRFNFQLIPLVPCSTALEGSGPAADLQASRAHPCVSASARRPAAAPQALQGTGRRRAVGKGWEPVPPHSKSSTLRPTARYCCTEHCEGLHPIRGGDGVLSCPASLRAARLGCRGCAGFYCRRKLIRLWQRCCRPRRFTRPRPMRAWTASRSCRA
eukprot:scaffold1541_cov256-Pinguiococcus_pyrenoidosus.AAC.12